MKKLASLALAFALCAACAAPVLADETKTTTITTTINPTYTVVIPAATNITFNHTDTNLNGTLHLSAAQLDPDHEVTISATEHELVNQADNTKTIQFTCMKAAIPLLQHRLLIRKRKSNSAPISTKRHGTLPPPASTRAL